jgi:cysteine-rich repeat protein
MNENTAMHRAQPSKRRSLRSPGVALGTLLAAAVAAATGSCFFSSATNVCASGLRCAPGFVCDMANDACIEIGGCGDGHVSTDRGEVCDDGNTQDGDGCSADCESTEVCGNGVIDAAIEEQCDDKNTRDGDGCSSKCRFEQCGNRVLDQQEVCDDGNALPGDGCNADCTSNEACGNGITDNEPDGPIHEDCDPVDVFPAPATDSDACDSDCTFPVCGDGHFNKLHLVTGMGPDHVEQCDTAGDSETCDDDCTFVTCGDGHPNVPAGEQCDLGSENSNLPDKQCRTDCRKRACGDGIVDGAHGEVCDDGDDDVHDACPSGPTGTCKDAKCGDGFVRTGVEQCDTGTNNSDSNADACRTTCVNAFCGDGVKDSNEACDKGGNGRPEDGCSGQLHCNNDCTACM